jgi:hypothetical protein
MDGTMVLLAEAFYEGAWFPARVIRPLDGGRVLVDVTGPTGRHRVSLHPDQVRSR